MSSLVSGGSDDPERLREDDRARRAAPATCRATEQPRSAPSARPGCRRGSSRPCRPRRRGRARSTPCRRCRRDLEAREGERDAEPNAMNTTKRRQAAEELDVDRRDPPVGADRRQPHERQHVPSTRPKTKAPSRVDEGVVERAAESWVRVSTIRSPRKKTASGSGGRSATAMSRATAATRTAYCTHRMRWARLRGESLRTRPAAAGDVMAVSSRTRSASRPGPSRTTSCSCPCRTRPDRAS